MKRVLLSATALLLTSTAIAINAAPGQYESILDHLPDVDQLDQETEASMNFAENSGKNIAAATTTTSPLMRFQEAKTISNDAGGEAGDAADAGDAGTTEEEPAAAATEDEDVEKKDDAPMDEQAMNRMRADGKSDTEVAVEQAKRTMITEKMAAAKNAMETEEKSEQEASEEAQKKKEEEGEKEPIVDEKEERMNNAIESAAANEKVSRRSS